MTNAGEYDKMEFDESKHPRDRDGKFTDGGENYSDSVNGRIERAKENGIDLPLNADGSVDDLKLQERLEEVGNKELPVKLSKQEYSILRKEVMRKNAAQKGRVKPTNFAYTSNNFYVYLTKGDDDFKPLIKLDIEDNSDLISLIESVVRRKNGNKN